MSKIILGIALSAAFIPSAFAGVLYEIETTEKGLDGPKVSVQKIMVQDKKLKMDIAESGHSGAVVFTGGQSPKVVYLDAQEKKYMVMDKEQVDAMAGQLGQAMSQMEEALKHVPEAQRPMVEEMMKGKMKEFQQEQEQKPKAEIKKTNGTDTVNGYPCVEHEVWEEGKKEKELCLTAWGDIEGGQEVKEIFGDMVSFFENMAKAMSQSIPGMGAGMLDGEWNYMSGLEGFPVRIRELRADGSVQSESTLRSVKKQSFKATDFEPAPEYSRQTMPGGPR